MILGSHAANLSTTLTPGVCDDVAYYLAYNAATIIILQYGWFFTNVNMPGEK